MMMLHQLALVLIAYRIDDTIIALEASGREEMFLWLQELQTRRKDFVKQNRAAARTQVSIDKSS